MNGQPGCTDPETDGHREVRRYQLQIGAHSIRAAVWPGDTARTPILLFNGVGGNIELLQPFIEALGSRVEVIAFDVPGTGESRTPSFPYSMRSLARVAVRLLERFGHRRADVVGVSWGGALALQFAHSAPDRCRRLVLCATTAGLPLYWPASPNVLLKMLTPRRYLDRAFMAGTAGKLYGGRFRRDRALVRGFMERIKEPRRLGYLFQLVALLGWTSAPWIWRVRQPTLILTGTDDPLVPPVNGRILAALIPDARLRTLDEGHLFILAEPERSARIVHGFLDRGDGGAEPVPSRKPRPVAMCADPVKAAS